MKIRYNQTPFKNRYNVFASIGVVPEKYVGCVWKSEYIPFSKIPHGWLASGPACRTGGYYKTRKLAAEALIK